jgi:hypothetical protein
MVLSSKKYDPGCSSRIPDPDADFLPSRIPDPEVKKAPNPGSRIRIRNTDTVHINKVSLFTDINTVQSVCKYNFNPLTYRQRQAQRGRLFINIFVARKKHIKNHILSFY